MKKLLFVFLIVALASYLFVGCIPVTPSEGEGEGEGEVEGVTVVIEGAAVVDSKTYVSEGPHDITVTFPAPVAGVVTATITDCTGDYSKAIDAVGTSVVLFPDATKKIWTGSGTFAASDTECCASYVEVNSGECSDVVCIALPVIVDGEPPEATVEVCLADCDCAGCELVFSSHTNEEECLPDEVICGDDCSGLASWSIDIFDRYPFDECCETPCYEPIESGSGVCPIDFTTSCLADLTNDTAYVLVTLVDNVGNSTRFGATIAFNADTCDTITTFTEWDNDCVDTANFVFCDDADVNHPDVYTLTVNIVGSGSVAKSPDRASYISGTVVTLNPQAAAGWTFTGWSVDLSGSADPEDITMDSNKTVTATFTQTLGPEAVDLGTAESEGFVILSEAGITDIPASVITGNIGTWPIDGATIGVTCAEVSGTIYDRDAAYTGGGGGVTTCRLTDDTLLNTAVIDMRAAYTAAANATPGVGPFLNLGGGTVAGQTLVPGVYTWGSNVTITTNLILSGGANDVWIFQITGTLDISSNMKVLLTGGAQAKNIFWQVADVVTLGTGSHFEGIILAKTKIAMQTGASINGRLWAQTEVTLDQNTVTEP